MAPVFGDGLQHKGLGGPAGAALLPPERMEEVKDGDG